MKHIKGTKGPTARVIAPRRSGDMPEPNLEPGRELIKRLGWASALFIASMVVSVAVSGCGGTEQETYVSNAEPAGYGQAQETYYVPDTIEEAAAPLETVTGDEQYATRAGDLPTSSSMESWPPDMVVSISDTLVSPGEVVEIIAEATPDVVEIALWDGIGEKEPFYFDADSGVWRVTYRAPLKPRWQRTGLSITAKNDADRWRRMWVFVNAESATAKMATLAPPQEVVEQAPAIEQHPNEAGEETPEAEPEDDGS